MQPTQNRKRNAYAWAVVAVWLVGTAYAFWAFELKHQRSFESAHTVLFDSGSRARSAEAWFHAVVAPQRSSESGHAATVVHVYAANCPCNRFTNPHLARIVAGYQRRGVSFVTVARGSIDLAWIEATPAALVFDASGKLVYFGPYSDSARCGESGGLVERVLDRVLGGQAPRPQPFYGGGCFCASANNIQLTESPANV
jgi:uncharacterized protein DUF6436